MKRIVLLSVTLFCIGSSIAFAQSTTISPGTVLPQITTAQRSAMTNPNGILVFDINTQSYWFRQSGVWVELPKGGSTSNYWQLNGVGGNEIINTNSGGFWSANSVGLNNGTNNTSNPPTTPVSGDGTRLMWIPSRSAFRVGTVDQGLKSWDKDSIGLFSHATGYNSKAKAMYSTAIGYYTTASGKYSMAIGKFTTASGDNSTVIGDHNNSSGDNATAMGYYSTASGQLSMAFGFGSYASEYSSIAIGNGAISTGNQSIALGNGVTSSGNSSIAFGNQSVASGNYSTAMGQDVSTNGYDGAFIVGDGNPTGEGITNSGISDQFVARFSNGYYLLTSGNGSVANPRTGVQISHGQTAWSAISDSTKKEYFLAANGEFFLQKLKNLKLGSWNYKTKDKNPERFYGPMAQEIYAAYGKDIYGNIGCDTLVNTLNMDGILFIYAQTLEKRTSELKSELEGKEQRIKELEKRSEGQNQKFAELEIENNQMKSSLENIMKRLVAIEAEKILFGKR